MLAFLLSCWGGQEETPKEPPQKGVGAELSAAVMWHAMDLERYEEKVERAEAFYLPQIQDLDPNKELIVILGGSSSGGMRLPDEATKFWPDWIAEKHPDFEVQSLSFGGATTWHIRKLMERLQLKAHTCILYAGHNDRMRSAPRQSLASIERGEEPKSEAFTYWVEVKEAEENMSFLAKQCGYLVAMEEFRSPDNGEVKAFARVLMRHRDVVHLEAAAFLAERGAHLVLQDQIHLSPYGHQLLGTWVAEKLPTLWQENEQRQQ